MVFDLSISHMLSADENNYIRGFYKEFNIPVQLLSDTMYYFSRNTLLSQFTFVNSCHWRSVHRCAPQAEGDHQWGAVYILVMQIATFLYIGKSNCTYRYICMYICTYTYLKRDYFL